MKNPSAGLGGFADGLTVLYAMDSHTRQRQSLQRTSGRAPVTPGERWRRNLAKISRRIRKLIDDGGAAKVAAQLSPAQRDNDLLELREFSARAGAMIAELEGGEA